MILDVNDNLQFHTIYEAINYVVGKNYKGWMQGCWPSAYGADYTNYRIWFPKLAESKGGELVPASNDCLNVLSSDWNEIVYDDLKQIDLAATPRYTGYDLLFAKEPSGGPYIFRGVYLFDKEKSHLHHFVGKRVGTKVRMIGPPSYYIEIIKP